MRLRHAALLLLLAGCEGDPGSAPQPFYCLTPAPGAVGVALDTSFQWSHSIRADTYTIEIATDPAFGTTLFTQAGLTVQTFTPPAPLPGSTTIYWRVSGFNPKGSITTATANFNSAGPPGAFSLVGPADTAVGVSTTPTYSWTASAVADSYLLEVATDVGFGAGTIVVSLPGITITAATPAVTLAAATQHFWRVTSQNGFGTVVATGAPFDFTTL